MFEKHLPLKDRSNLKNAAEGGQDDVSERQQAANIKLFSWVDALNIEIHDKEVFTFVSFCIPLIWSKQPV